MWSGKLGPWPPCGYKMKLVVGTALAWANSESKEAEPCPLRRRKMVKLASLENFADWVYSVSDLLCSFPNLCSIYVFVLVKFWCVLFQIAGFWFSCGFCLFAAVLFILQGFGGQRSDCWVEERFGNKRDSTFSWSVPQYQAWEYESGWSRQVPSHGMYSNCFTPKFVGLFYFLPSIICFNFWRGDFVNEIRNFRVFGLNIWVLIYGGWLCTGCYFLYLVCFQGGNVQRWFGTLHF